MFNAKAFKEKILDLAANPQPEPVTISIPADHPVGARIKKLFEFYATATVHPSGLRVQHRREDPEAVKLIVRELRSAVVELGGDPAALDAIHEVKDPVQHLLGSLPSLLAGVVSEAGR